MRSLALALAAGLAACTGPRAPGDGTPSVEYELHQVGPSTTVPDWSGRGNGSGTVELFGSRERARTRLEETLLAGVPGTRRSDALGFFENTDFDEAVLVYVASEGPDTCYDEVEVRELSVDGDALTGTVAARDTSEPGQGCGDAITYPAALVRVTADTLPVRAELTVTNGWGDESVVTASTDG